MQLPLIHLEFCSMRTADDPDDRSATLTAIDIQTGLAMASGVAKKGDTEHAIRDLHQFWMATGRKRVILYTGSDTSILGVALLRGAPGLSLRASTTSHEVSSGVVERFKQALHVRTKPL